MVHTISLIKQKGLTMKIWWSRQINEQLSNSQRYLRIIGMKLVNTIKKKIGSFMKDKEWFESNKTNEGQLVIIDIFFENDQNFNDS